MGNIIYRKAVAEDSRKKCSQKYGKESKDCTQGVKYAAARYEEREGGAFWKDLAKHDCRENPDRIWESHEFSRQRCLAGYGFFSKGLEELGPKLAASKTRGKSGKRRRR